MATRWVSPTGSGSGTSSGSPMSISAACSQAVAGDVVNIMPGYYTGTINPSNSGTSASVPITFQASDSSNRPIFTGAYGASNGSTAPPNQNTGWNPVNGTGLLSYGGTLGNSSPAGNIAATSGSPNIVHRKTGIGETIAGVWINEPILGSNPLGRWSSLWMTDLFDTGGGNPDHRIHAWGEQTVNSDRHSYFGDPRNKMHDWKSQARWNGGGTLDVRLHTTTTPNPGSYAKVVLGRNYKFFDFGENYITFKNLIFQHAIGGQVSGSVGFVMDGCLMYQCSNDCLIVGAGSHDSILRNCQFISAGSMQEHHADIVNIGVCDRVQVLNCYFAYGSHGGLTSQGTFNGQTVDGCEFYVGCTAYSAQSYNSPDTVSNNLVLQNCKFHDYFGEDPYIQRTPHPAIEIDSLDGGLLRRNLFYRCAIGILLQQGSDPAHTIANIDIRHNTIVDCQFASIKINGTASNVSNIQARNNILVGPSGGEAYYRQVMVSGGVTPNVHLDLTATPGSLTFRNNLYWERVADGVVPAATKGSAGTFGNILGGGGAAASNSTLWGPSNFLSGDIDPQFTNPAWVSGDDYTLKSTSPALGKGVSISGEPGTDLGYAQFGGGGGSPTNNPPSVNLTASPLSGNAPLSVTFDANASDPANSDGSAGTSAGALAYSWTFGDGQTASGTGSNFDNQTHSYANPGNYTCSVTVTDSGTPIGPAMPTTVTIGITVNSASAGTEITSGLTCTSFGTLGTDQAGQTADKLVDGFWATGSRGGGGGGSAGVNNAARSGLIANPQGWVADIGRTTTLTRVLVSQYPGGGGTRNYNVTLATSPNNSTWTNIPNGTFTTVLPSASEFSEVAFSPIANVRYVRLTVNSASPTAFDIASFWELRPFEIGTTNVAPTLNLTSNVASGTAPLAVTFTSGASDPVNSDSSAGTPAASLVYAWDFGDSTTSNGTGTSFATRNKTYNAAGTYTCSVTVTDAGTPNLFTTATRQIVVTGGGTATNVAPNVNLQTSPSPATISAGGSVTFTANASDPVNSDGSAGTSAANLSYVWDFGDGSALVTGTGTSFDVRSHVYAAAGTYVCTVTVSDNGSTVPPVQSTARQVQVVVGGGGTNAWPITDCWDNLNTPGSAIFAPQRTLLGKVLEDGDHSAKWISSGPIQNGVTFLAWDLGQNRAIKRLRLPMGKSANGYQYVITAQYSTNGTTWTNVPGVVGVTTGANVTYSEYVLGNAISARYVRVLFLSSSNSSASCFAPRFSDS